MPQDSPNLRPVFRILNDLRAERGLPKVGRPGAITRQVIHQVVVAAWSKYPGALTRADFTLGPLTAELVQQEVDTKISDLRRGVVLRKGSVPDSHFS